jgi:hypothetical protein
MIIGVIIQVTAIKGHNATAQFIIGRTITGVGNGIVSLLSSVITTRLTSAEHLHNPNLPSRMQPIHQPWSTHLYRRWSDCFRHHDRLLG